MRVGYMRSEYGEEQTSPSEAQAFQQGIAAQGTMYGVTRRLGLIRLFGASMWRTPGMPEKISTEMALLTTSQRSIDTQSAEALERATDDTQLQAAPSLGNLPLIVL